MKYVLPVLLTVMSGYIAAEMSADEFVKHIDGFRGYQDKGFSFSVVNISYRPDKEPRQNQLQVKVLDDKSLVKFLSPAREKGRAMLKEGKDMWLHIPGTRRVIRVAPAQRLLGETSNGDVVGIKLHQDYSAKVLGPAENDKEVELLLTAKDKKSLYYQVKFRVEKDAPYRPVKSEFYSLSGKLIKTAFYKEFKSFEGEEKLHKLLLVDPIQEGRYTWMMFDNYQEQSLNENIFQKESLTRL
ncbi:outer membrane lipoprotein-sorting protein [Pleionea sp. CnH1-48]|uniref:outer membrane lipoprotein-sorting protein n=1 Tax=Pleionea sp. CnH1-48 TaxID=2954494 RepID=UPI0020984750|nr:outer membrane lipoprotein-sorting protein [Pleionea sp. CnH1-48]MCO7225528.1 outer membrane lipoprotein-sorting protein [Pleionea sp. CnH1-48]